jgi:hypothetical protein
LKIKTAQLPFVLTLLALPLNWIVSFTGIGILVWMPEVLAMCALAYLAFAGRTRLAYSVPQLFLLSAFLVQLALQVASGRAPGSSAMLSILLMTLAFLTFFRAGRAETLLPDIFRQICFIYLVHICFILVEALLLKTGNIGLLTALSGGRYKPAFEVYSPVPQSLSMQSQAAAEFCTFSSVWFLLFYFSRKKLWFRFQATHGFILAASIGVLVAYPNATMWAVSVVLLIPMFFVSPFRASKLVRLSVIAGLVFAAGSIYVITVGRLSGDEWRTLIIRETFANPLSVFPTLSQFDQLWGTGGFGQESAATTNIFLYTDFGMAITVIQAGLVISVLSVVALLGVSFRMMRISFDRALREPPTFAVVWLGYVNALIVLGNFLSTVHYTVSLQEGGRALFSFHIAVTILAFNVVVRAQRETRVVSAPVELPSV